MNPGYAGRTELPENLKALFRSCAMVVPDLVLICENMLMSEGFTQARTLSRKFVSLYMLCRDLLSKAKHYDWALRAIKSVLRQAGGLKRSDPDLPEDPLLMRALRDFNIPKIITDDKTIFLRLIGDLFPKAEAPSKQDPELFKIVKDTAKRDMGYVNEDSFVIKIVQLKEILEVRHCCFVIGPPGCGKTAVWKTLARSMTNKGEDTEYDTLNPKAVTSDELFGAYSKTREWKHGVLAVIMKNQNKNMDKYKSSHKLKWSILDGDIDPEWIESLNTVMDDNKVLTLVSNERVALTPEMRLLFEISNLRNATPATVSRAGVLYINETDIGWMPYMNQWSERSIEKVLKGTKEGANIVESLEIDEVGKFIFFKCFQQYFESNVDVHDKDRVRYIAPMADMGMVQSICTILDQMLVIYADKLKAIKDRSEEDLKQCYEAMFLFAGIWGIGGGVGGGQDDEKDLKDFSSVWKSAAKVKFPEQGTVYDYFWDFDNMKWENWTAKV
jgi:dynein heavy chain